MSKPPRIFTEKDKFNKLTYVRELPPGVDSVGKPKRYALFRCDCGVEKRIHLTAVTSGHTQSCGCFQMERAKESKNASHNLSKTPLYKRWLGIRRRCLDPKDEAYKDYGGRGITVCEEWKNDPVAFYNWAMANGYQPHLEIDRRDNNKGYSPDNCRFVTTKVNTNNTRKNLIVSYNGVEMTLANACDLAGVRKKYWKALERVNRGISFEEALKTINIDGRKRKNTNTPAPTERYG